MGLLSVNEALSLVLSAARRLPFEACRLSHEQLGRVLAEDVASDIDSPPFDKAMVDGYAVRSVDVQQQASLTIVDEILAGRVSDRALQPGEAACIMTGAAIPPGADAVIMHEATSVDDATRRVSVPAPVKARQNIMARAAEMKQGEVVLSAGSVLRPQEIGLLATVGKISALVYRTPCIAVLSTGDEIVEPDKHLMPGQIRNSNAGLLMSLSARAGADPNYLGIAKDTIESLRPMLQTGLSHDVLLISGGVSAGKVDLVPGVLQELGVQAVFHKVSLKPGKPLFFGTLGNTLVFGLPGNPVSSLVGFELFVRPALRKLIGRSAPFESPIFQAHWLTSFVHKSDRPTYYPVTIQRSTSVWKVQPVPWQGSGDLRSLCNAQGFAVLPSGEVGYGAGDVVDVLMPEIDN